MAKFPILEVDAEDVKLIKALQRETGKQVRVLWSPAPTRRMSKLEPTHAEFISDEPEFVGYFLYELEKARAERQQAPEGKILDFQARTGLIPYNPDKKAA